MTIIAVLMKLLLDYDKYCYRDIMSYQYSHMCNHTEKRKNSSGRQS